MMSCFRKWKNKIKYTRTYKSLIKTMILRKKERKKKHDKNICLIIKKKSKVKYFVEKKRRNSKISINSVK